MQNVHWSSVIAITMGAIPGAMSRYYLTEFCKKAIGKNFPYGTLLINFTGCLLMGFFFTLFKEIPGFPPNLDLMVRTGFLGSYTTFSTYGFDTFALWENGKKGATIFYWIGSATLAIIGILLGRYFANLL